LLDAPHIDGIQREFAEALPRIEGLAGAYLRMRPGERKDEAIAETVALAWRAYRDLALQGRDVVKLLGKIVEFSAKRVRCGGRLVGMQPVRDVMSDTARFRHKYRVGSLPLSDAEDANPEITDALRDASSPADEATFRVDLEAWLDGLDERREAVARQLASGLNTVEVARLHGVTRGRISQLREDLINSWERFNNDHMTR
jgi:hypothetical protein